MVFFQATFILLESFFMRFSEETVPTEIRFIHLLKSLKK